MKKVEKDTIIEWSKDYFSYLLAGMCILILVFMMIFRKTQYTITIIGCISIVALAIEKRARVFDKVVSMLVIFFLAAGFMMFG